MKTKLLICFSILILFSSILCGCKKREFSAEELKNDLIRVEFVEFFLSESEEYELHSPDENGETYEVYLTLLGEDAICVAEELSGLKYEHWFGEPRWLNGKGIIMTYEDKKFYFSGGAMLEANSDGLHHQTGGTDLVEDVFNKYCPYVG